MNPLHTVRRLGATLMMSAMLQVNAHAHSPAIQEPTANATTKR